MPATKQIMLRDMLIFIWLIVLISGKTFEERMVVACLRLEPALKALSLRNWGFSKEKSNDMEQNNGKNSSVIYEARDTIEEPSMPTIQEGVEFDLIFKITAFWFGDSLIKFSLDCDYSNKAKNSCTNACENSS